MTTRVVIDSSYFNFYRVCATISWFKRDESRVEQWAGVPWLDCPVFMTTFEKMWFQTVRDITRQFRVKMSDLIFARDGANVWRYEKYPEYKSNRNAHTVDDPQAPGPVFKHVNEVYHPRVTKHVHRIDHLEADDIIAIIARDLAPSDRLVIITGDKDLLQLCSENVRVFKLSGKGCVDISIPADATVNFTMQKILKGDPADNIPPVFKGCGKVTAERMAADPELREAKLSANNAHAQFELNTLLVDLKKNPYYLTTMLSDTSTEPTSPK